MKQIVLLACCCIMFTACRKKACEKENYGNVTYKNLTGQKLKVKVDNTIPTGCIADNGGFLNAGGECNSEMTADLNHAVVVLTEANQVYWEFTFSVGPCGDKVIEIR